jgi:xanthine dehydrogenase YagT iron-sulfur-binding subunit
MNDERNKPSNIESGNGGVSRRKFLQSAATAAGASLLPVAFGAEEKPPGTESGAGEPGAVTADAASAAGAGSAGPRSSLRLNVNGTLHEVVLEPRVTLLDALREHLGFVGTKKGCDRGQCGACTVLINERRVNSCLSLAVMHEHDVIVTVEGLSAANGGMHPLQQAFVEHDAFQCGFCTPGQICSAVGLLNEHRQTGEWGGALSEADVRERMSGNICRCGAYPNIVAAIRAVASRAGNA